MYAERLNFRTRIPAPAQAVFDWHKGDDALAKLVPPWQKVRIVERQGGIEDGNRTVLELRFGPFKRRWVAEHYDYVEGRQFCDKQVSGPFAYWRHRHRVIPDGTDACYLVDEVTVALPFGKLGHLLGASMLQRQLSRLFAYRHTVIIRELREEGEALAAEVSSEQGPQATILAEMEVEDVETEAIKPVS